MLEDFIKARDVTAGSSGTELVITDQAAFYALCGVHFRYFLRDGCTS